MKMIEWTNNKYHSLSFQERECDREEVKRKETREGRIDNLLNYRDGVEAEKENEGEEAIRKSDWGWSIGRWRKGR